MPLLRLALLATLVSGVADAQILKLREPRLRDQWVYGINAFGGLPVGEFRQHEDGGGGMEATLGFQPFRRQPLAIRGNAAFLLYGRFNRDRTREICDSNGDNCRDETVWYNSRYHNMSIFQIGPEFMATDGAWRPFAYALIGLTYFSSWAYYGDPSLSSSSTYLLSSHNRSSAYGAGIRGFKQTFGRETGFELALRFTRNAQSTYLTDKGVYRRSDGTYDISPVTGAANVLGIHMGVWVGPYINWNER